MPFASNLKLLFTIEVIFHSFIILRKHWFLFWWFNSCSVTSLSPIPCATNWKLNWIGKIHFFLTFGFFENFWMNCKKLFEWTEFLSLSYSLPGEQNILNNNEFIIVLFILLYTYNRFICLSCRNIWWWSGYSTAFCMIIASLHLACLN